MKLFLFLLCLAPGAVSPSPERELALKRDNCAQFWYSFNGRCYKYIATTMTWIDAELHCVSEGSNLVSIHSQEEENFVKHLIRNFDLAEGVNWIGLTDAQRNGAWLWSDGSKVDFTSWNGGEPNNSGGSEECVHTNWGTNKGWNDKECSFKYSFVCATRTIYPQLQSSSDSTL
ncbi:lactose-binding lectin l-2-like [Odontesthes bonariensis]|uniref:lactose-binding lectin l-2-like n=1 Tax=Odontesthes bonariensis TaxID=219752 RepID=UPI003F58F2CE